MMGLAALHQLHLLITYVACYTTSLKNTVSALVEYLNLDCSIRVSRIIELDSCPQ